MTGPRMKAGGRDLVGGSFVSKHTDLRYFPVDQWTSYRSLTEFPKMDESGASRRKRLGRKSLSTIMLITDSRFIRGWTRV